MNHTEILKYCEHMLSDYTKQNLTWKYENGVLLLGAHYLSELKNEYYNFVLNYLDQNINLNGHVIGFDDEEFNIDNIQPSKLLFKAYEVTKKENYLNAINNLYHHLQKHPRTNEGSFWHKRIYPYQVWLDGLYMAQPFYMEYETKFNKMKKYKDIYTQFMTVRKRLFNDEKALHYHAYDESREMFWCDPQTGLSKNFWLRAIGWHVMALIDTLESMDEQIFFEYRTLRNLFKEAIDGILRYQDLSGMWYQVVDKQTEQGNYLETSGTAMISYAILKAVRLGFLPIRYQVYGVNAFNGICDTYLKERDGVYHLGGICEVAGLGGKLMRSGTFEYYISEPVVEDEKKGVGAFMMAFSEVLKIKE